MSVSPKPNTTGRMNCGCAYARYVRDTGRYSSDFFWGSRDPWLGSQFFLVPTRLYCQTEWMPVIKQRKVFGPGFPSPIGHHWPTFLFWIRLRQATIDRWNIWMSSRDLTNFGTVGYWGWDRGLHCQRAWHGGHLTNFRAEDCSCNSSVLQEFLAWYFEIHWMFMTPKVVCTPRKWRNVPRFQGPFYKEINHLPSINFQGDMLIFGGVSERKMCEQMNESAWDGWLGWLASH